MPAENCASVRWQSFDAAMVLRAMADYAKDQSYLPRLNTLSSRCHASVAGTDFEILCSGRKLWDHRANSGGGGALNLPTHLFGIGSRRRHACFQSAIYEAALLHSSS